MASLSEGRVFTFEQKKWCELYEKNYFLPETPRVEELEDAFVLPLKKRKDADVLNSAFEGGVCNKDGHFIAGQYRSFTNPSTNFSCSQAYPIPSGVTVRHETVVFGGILAEHFGHFITDSMARLWWFAEHPDTPYKLIFLRQPKGEYPIHFPVLEAAGITKDRLEIITEPTRFDQVIVPQEAFYMYTHYRPGAEKIYRYISARVPPGPYKKIYLSRTRLPVLDMINEQYFENFYRQRGYEIIYPEKFSFSEQVSLMVGADEVVATHGTLVHLTSFCRPHTKVIVLNRCRDNAHIFVHLEACELDYYIVDAHFCFLPATTPSSNIYFLGPTIHWVKYLDTVGIAYDPEEVSFEKHVKPYIYDYVISWGKLFSIPSKLTKPLRNMSVVDVISDINQRFLHSHIDRKSYPDRDDITKLKKQNATLKSKVMALETIFQTALSEQARSNPAQLQQIAEEGGLDRVAILDRMKIQALEQEVSALQKKLSDMESSLNSRIIKPLWLIKSWFRRL